MNKLMKNSIEEKSVKVYKTMDLELLKLMDESGYEEASNRDYHSNPSKKHIKALKKDILKIGQLKPITVDENGFIYAGQHRYCAIRELVKEDNTSENFDGSITYMITKLSYIDYQKSENLERKHNKDDQIMTLGTGDMHEFLKKYKDYKTRNGNYALYAMAQWADGNGGDSSNKIKKGIYCIPSWEKGFKIMKRLDDINIILKKLIKHRITADNYNYVYSLITNPIYEHERFLFKLESYFSIKENKENKKTWEELGRSAYQQKHFFNMIYNYEEIDYIEIFKL